MRTVALVLACLACAGLGGRVKVTIEQMPDESDAEHHNSQKVDNTAPSSHSLAELEQSQSNVQAGVPILLRAPTAAFATATRRLNRKQDAGLVFGVPAVAVARRGHGPTVAITPRLRPVTGHGHKLAANNALKSQSGFTPNDDFEDAVAKTSNLTKPMQLPREDWPEGEWKFHRFIRPGDPTLEEYPLGYVYKTLDRFQGTRNAGTYKGSSRVLFASPGNDDHATSLKTIELLKTGEEDNPSFAAVEVQLPLDMVVEKRVMGSGWYDTGWQEKGTVFAKARHWQARERLVVTDVKEGNAKYAGIRKGDIIRAVSVPEPEVLAHPGRLRLFSGLPRLDQSWWKMFQLPKMAPAAEDGMAVLDQLGVSAYNAVLRDNMRRNGKNAKVVLLIERPVRLPDPRDDDDFDPNDSCGGMPCAVPVPIPIPVEADPDPRYPPQGWPALSSVLPISNNIEGVDASTDTFYMNVSDEFSPDAKDDEERKEKERNEYIANLGEAVDSLRRDIPQILRFEDDARRMEPTNWGIYTDSLETDVSNVLLGNLLEYPVALRLLEAVMPSWSARIKGLSTNQKALKEMRNLLHKFVSKDAVLVLGTRMISDPSTGADVIEYRWRTKLVTKNFEIPFLLQSLVGSSKTGEKTIIVEARSRFHLNAEGKIFLHSVDQFDLILDVGHVNDQLPGSFNPNLSLDAA